MNTAEAALHKSRELTVQLAVLLLVAISAFAFVAWLVTTSLGRSERAGDERKDIAVATFCADELSAAGRDLLTAAVSAIPSRDAAAYERATKGLNALRGALARVCEPLLPADTRAQLAAVKRELTPYTIPLKKGTP